MEGTGTLRPLRDDANDAAATAGSSDYTVPQPGSSFPMTEEEFNSDPRVSFARTTGKWTLEADDGSEFEYDEALRRWIPVVCIPIPSVTPYP